MRYLGKITDDKDLVTKEYVDGVADETLETAKDYADGLVEQLEPGGNSIKMWFGTRAEYNALDVVDPDVCYCIEEGT